MEFSHLRENPIWASKDELNKQKLIETAYKKMHTGIPLTKDEDDAFKEYTKLMKDINQAKGSADANKALFEEKNKHANLLRSFFEKTDDELKEKAASRFISNVPQAPSKLPSYEDAMMASLMKDTPTGTYQNAQAKMLAESEAVRNNYIRAFTGVQNESANTFHKLLKNDPELSHPDNIEESKKYYSILRDFAPAIANNPVTLKGFIMKAKSYGGIDTKELTNLIQTNNEFMKHRTNI